jgi:hypothetical protein
MVFHYLDAWGELDFGRNRITGGASAEPILRARRSGSVGTGNKVETG